MFSTVKLSRQIKDISQLILTDYVSLKHKRIVNKREHSLYKVRGHSSVSGGWGVHGSVLIGITKVYGPALLAL